jgi:hypothetical protein
MAERLEDTSRPLSGDRLSVGRLVDHGAARHEFRERAELSYFVKLQTDRGLRTFWHPALKTALEESVTQPKIGDQVGVKENSIEPVTVVVRKPGPNGQTVRSYDSARTHWVIEKRERFDELADAANLLRNPKVHPRDAVRTHRELLPAYIILDSARKHANARFDDLENVEQHVAFVREALALTVERGEPLPKIGIRERAQAQETEARTPRDPERGGRVL